MGIKKPSCVKGRHPKARMPVRFLTILIVLLTLCGMQVFVGAQTIDQMIATALEGNPGLAMLREEMEDLKSKTPGGKILEKFELTLAPSWYQDSSGGSPGASISFFAPLLPQLSANVSYDFDAGEGNFGITLRPFTKGEDLRFWQDTIASKNAKYLEESAKVRARAELFYVSMVISLERRQISVSRLTISETLYRGAVFKYESGLLSYKDFKEAFQDYQLCLQDMLKAEKALVDLRKSALDIFGSVAALESATDWSITEEELLGRGKDVERILSKAKDPVSADLIQLEAELGRLEREQSGTRAWQPKISLGATTESNFGSVDANIALTLSLDQIKSDEKAKLTIKAQTKRQDVDRKKLGMGYTVRMLGLQSETLKEGIGIYRNAVKLAEGVYAEALVRFKAGFLDKESLESARLDTLDARLSLYQALADYLSSLRDLQLHYLYLIDNGGN